MSENTGAKIQLFHRQFREMLDDIEDMAMAGEMDDSDLKGLIIAKLNILYEEYENLFSDIIVDDFS